MARLAKTSPVADGQLRERIRERAVMMDSFYGAESGNPWTPRIVQIDRGETIVVAGFELRGVPGTELGGHYEVDADGVVLPAVIDRGETPGR